MVVFNGRSILDALPVRIIDVQVGSVEQAITTLSSPTGNASRFVRSQGQKREIIIPFTILEPDMRLRGKHAEALRAWAYSDKPKKLIVPQRREQYINAICTELPTISGREWWEELSMTFTAYDPYFINEAEKRVPCDGRVFAIGGSAEPLPVIRATLAGPVQSPTWTLDERRVLSLYGAIPPGRLEINLDPDVQTITLDGASIADNLTFQADFFDISIGVHTLQGPGALYWKERWQ